MTSAVQREAEWLSTSGDGLVALKKTDGGPFDVVQAYWPRTPNTRQTGLYVLRGSLSDDRFAQDRRIQRHALRLRVVWPIGSTTVATGLWEDEQAALDAAVDAVLVRIRAHVYDHTHGGRFLSVAEAPQPGRIEVRFTDASALGPQAGGQLRADITYSADDRDFTA
jgi:hypothetical protein